VKNSDIKNFEKHLNNYLNFIRNYNKDIQHFYINKDYFTNPVFKNEEEEYLDRKILTNEKEKDFVKSI